VDQLLCDGHGLVSGERTATALELGNRHGLHCYRAIAKAAPVDAVRSSDIPMGKNLRRLRLR
jgi:hypothetical protein